MSKALERSGNVYFGKKAFGKTRGCFRGRDTRDGTLGVSEKRAYGVEEFLHAIEKTREERSSQKSLVAWLEWKKIIKVSGRQIATGTQT